MNRYVEKKYIPGDWWVICQRCGFQYRKSEIRKEWTNLLVCRDCWEPRHPQDFVRAVKEKTIDSSFVSTENDGSQIGQPGQITDDVTLDITYDPVQYIGHLEADITITLDTSGFDDGDEFIITKYDLGPYSVNVDGLATIPKLQSKQIVVTFDTGAWVLTKEVTV